MWPRPRATGRHHPELLVVFSATNRVGDVGHSSPGHPVRGGPHGGVALDTADAPYVEQVVAEDSAAPEADPAADAEAPVNEAPAAPAEEAPAEEAAAE